MSLTEHHLRLAHGAITHQIIGAFYDVYNELGYGFLESVYAESLPIEFAARGLSFQREALLPIWYKGRRVGEFRADFVVEHKIVVELKAAERLHAAHEAQLLNYLRATGHAVGLLLNFGPQATVRRLIWTGASVERG